MSYYHHFSICERAKIEELNKLGSLPTLLQSASSGTIAVSHES